MYGDIDISTIKVVPGIYQHYSGKLFYVEGLSVNWMDYRKRDWKEFEILVKYYPLFPTDDPIKGKHLNLERFSGEVDVISADYGQYTGPRYKLVLPWELPDILPGCIHITSSGITYGSMVLKVVQVDIKNEKISVTFTDVRTGGSVILPKLSVEAYYPMIM